MKTLNIVSAMNMFDADINEATLVAYDRARQVYGIFEERCQKVNTLFGEYVMDAHQLIKDELYEHWVYYCNTHAMDKALIRALEIIIWTINGLDQHVRYHLGGILKQVFDLPYGWLTSHHVYDGDVYSPLYFAVLKELQKMVVTANYRLYRNSLISCRLIYAGWHVLDVEGPWEDFQDYSWKALPKSLRKKVLEGLAVHMAAIRKYMKVCDKDLLDNTIGNIQWWSHTSTEEVEQYYYLYK